MRHRTSRLSAKVLAFLAALYVPLAAQGPDYMAHYNWYPGGTPEHELWQVLVLVGAGLEGAGAWRGKVSISDGEIFDLDGYRFEPPDRVSPAGGWRAEIRTETMEDGREVTGHGRISTYNVVMPKGLLLRGSGSAATRLRFETSHGSFDAAPLRLAFGVWEPHLDGRVRVQRLPAATDLSGTEMRQHDFPSVAAGPGGTLSAAWQSYHDRREELNFRQHIDGKWTRLIPVARTQEDLWRPHAAVDDNGKPWLIWSHRPASDGPGNWDIYAMGWEDNAWGRRIRLSGSPLPDIEPSVFRAPDGTIYLVWQAFQGRSRRSG